MDIENIKGNQLKMKNTLEGTNSRLDKAEDHTSALEDKIAENTQPGQQQERAIREKEDGDKLSQPDNGTTSWVPTFAS